VAAYILTTVDRGRRLDEALEYAIAHPALAKKAKKAKR